LLSSLPHIDCVDILSVEPGFGGQSFQAIALSKVKALKRWRSEHDDVNFEIMVDGGIHQATFLDVVNAGADVLVTGSYLFQHSDRPLKERVDALRQLQPYR
jgi:ribulose-phosphate 3-epimerase